MRYRRVLFTAAVAVGIVTLSPTLQYAQASSHAEASSSLSKASSTKFKNCAALLKQFPNGIAKNKKAAAASGAQVNAKVYAANRSLDRDKDGVACETGKTTNAPTTSVAPAKMTTSKTFTFSNIGISAYSPNSYTIRVGDKVNWPSSHPASFFGAAGVTSRIFTSVGIFSFVCSIHGAQMRGSVTVQN